MTITLPSYFGGKNGNGTPQNLINHVPGPIHTVFIGFAGHDALVRNMRPAALTIINDMSPKVCDSWGKALRGTVTIFLALLPNFILCALWLDK